MREPGFASAWAMPAWFASHGTTPPFIPMPFTQHQCVPDSLTGQPIQEHDHVAIQDERKSPMTVARLLVGDRVLFWGQSRCGRRTGLHATFEAAVAEENRIDILWDTLFRLCRREGNWARHELHELLLKLGMGLFPLETDETFPDDLYLCTVTGSDPASIVLMRQDETRQYHCLKMFEGATYKDIKNELYAWLRSNGGGGPS